jgi:hypothetical protein
LKFGSDEERAALDWCCRMMIFKTFKGNKRKGQLRFGAKPVYLTVVLDEYPVVDFMTDWQRGRDCILLFWFGHPDWV